MKTAEQRQAWLIERQKGIGGSDAAAACGLSPWNTRYGLYLDKTMPILGDEIEREEFMWGHLLEPIIRQRFCDLHDVRILEPSGPIIHPEHDFMRCNPDGLIFKDDAKASVSNDSLDVPKMVRTKQFAATLQIKNWGHGKDQWGEPGTAEIPEQYMLQVQHEIECCQVEAAYVAILFHGNEYREYFVPRNDELIETLIEVEAEFWDCVVRRQPPEPETEGDVRKRWDKVFVHDMIEADDELVRLWEELGAARTQLKHWEHQQKSLEVALKKAIADTEGIVRNGKPLCTWKEQSQQRFDTDRFKAEHPELYEQFRKQITFRKFLYRKG